MNKMILPGFFLFSIEVIGQTDTTAVKFIEPPDSTGLGYQMVNLVFNSLSKLLPLIT